MNIVLGGKSKEAITTKRTSINWKGKKGKKRDFWGSKYIGKSVIVQFKVCYMFFCGN